MRYVVGQRYWEVEWCPEARSFDGECFPDDYKYVRRRFSSKEAALEFAKQVLPKDAFRSVRVTPVVAVDDFDLGRVTDFEAAGPSEFFEDGGLVKE